MAGTSYVMRKDEGEEILGAGRIRLWTGTVEVRGTAVFHQCCMKEARMARTAG